MVLALALLACRVDPPEPPVASPAPATAPASRALRLPPPIEHLLDSGAEKRSSAGRKAWIRQKHRSAPGVDWEGIERENGLRQIRRHTELTRRPPSGPVGRWIERGSSNQAGRTHVARLSPDEDTLYVGSDRGGLWRGDLGGGGWTPLGDDTYGGVHWLEVVPGVDASDPEILLTATDGGIVLRSTDGGLIWSEVEGLGSSWQNPRLTRMTDGSGTLLLINRGDDGIHLLRSTDAGAEWELLRTLDSVGDVWAPRDGGGTIWLAEGDEVSFSTDAGSTWTLAGYLPVGGETVHLVGSEAGAPTLYAVLDNRGLVRSDDAGESWVTLRPIGDYWGGSINVSTTDPLMVVYGGVELHKSFDGGGSFFLQNGWGDYYSDPANLLHADIPGIDVFPDGAGSEVWYINTDGGLYVSYDRLNTTQNLSLTGLRISQYYDVLTSSADPSHVAMGAQDQGYQITNDTVQDDGLYEAAQIISGDYGHLTSGDGTHAYVYSVYPGFILVQIGETNPSLAYLDFPADETYVPWLPPIVADPEDRTSFFFPASRLYRYEKGSGNRWSYTLWSEQDFRVRGDEYVSRLAFSPVDPRRAWALTSYGRAWVSDDKGVTWTRSHSMVADDNWYYGQAIAPSLTDRDVVTIGGSGYGVPAVYRSEDGGVTYVPWSDGLPDTLVYTLAEAPDRSGTIVAGTETSVYRRDPGADAWVEVGAPDAPITPYWDAEALPHENTIRFATYGRGLWDYQLDPKGTGCFPVVDRDGDGVGCDTDCDDADPAVYPGAAEACDGRDVDCDPNAPIEVDADADGSPACADCDDRDPVRHPDAEELCGDGIDEDCDGVDPACEADKTDPPEGCGCGTPLAPPMGLAWLAALLIRRRR